MIYLDDFGWVQISVEMIEGRSDTRSDFCQIPIENYISRYAEIKKAPPEGKISVKESIEIKNAADKAYGMGGGG